jgi:hypothetical protein
MVTGNSAIVPTLQGPPALAGEASADTIEAAIKYLCCKSFSPTRS